MFRHAALIAALCLALPAAAQDTEMSDPPALEIIEAGDHALSEFLWMARPLVVFADSPNDPRFVEQMEFIVDRGQDLLDRDVVVITDSNPQANSPIRQELRPRGFMFVLIGKDGLKYLRKPAPWHVRELTRSIDKMPIRKQELKEMRGME